LNILHFITGYRHGVICIIFVPLVLLCAKVFWWRLEDLKIVIAQSEPASETDHILYVILAKITYLLLNIDCIPIMSTTRDW